MYLMSIAIFSMLVSNSEARVYYKQPTMQKRISSQLYFRSFGVDEPKLKHYQKRSMLDASATRVSPGGPDPEHHILRPVMP